MMKRIVTFFLISLLHQVSAQESLIDTLFIDNQFSKVSKLQKHQTSLLIKSWKIQLLYQIC